MTHRPVQVDQRKRAASSRRRRCALLCQSFVRLRLWHRPCASTDTARSRDCSLVVVDVHDLLNLLDPSLGSDAASVRLVRGFHVDLVGRPSTSPRFQPRWCLHALLGTTSCHLVAQERNVVGDEQTGGWAWLVGWGGNVVGDAATYF